MRWTRRSWIGVVTVLGAALPFEVSGCGRTACITVTPSELAGGSCPGPAAAQARFASTPCQGPTVLGDGVLDHDLCCYPVELGNSVSCGEGEGAGSSAVSSGFFAGAGSSGGVGLLGTTCDDALHGAPFDQVTGDAATNLMSLETCACGGQCTTACNSTLCAMNAPDIGCLTCLQSNCSSQLELCQKS